MRIPCSGPDLELSATSVLGLVFKVENSAENIAIMCTPNLTSMRRGLSFQNRDLGHDKMSARVCMIEFFY